MEEKKATCWRTTYVLYCRDQARFVGMYTGITVLSTSQRDRYTDRHTHTDTQTDRATSVLRRHTFALGARNAAT